MIVQKDRQTRSPTITYSEYRFFVTKTGLYWPRTPFKVGPSDVVATLFDSKVPFFLQPWKNFYHSAR